MLIKLLPVVATVGRPPGSSQSRPRLASSLLFLMEKEEKKSPNFTECHEIRPYSMLSIKDLVCLCCRVRRVCFPRPGVCYAQNQPSDSSPTRRLLQRRVIPKHGGGMPGFYQRYIVGLEKVGDHLTSLLSRQLSSVDYMRCRAEQHTAHEIYCIGPKPQAAPSTRFRRVERTEGYAHAFAYHVE
jgi:hypothetical protein